jgi:hypothetical protein
MQDNKTVIVEDKIAEREYNRAQGLLDAKGNKIPEGMKGVNRVRMVPPGEAYRAFYDTRGNVRRLSDDQTFAMANLYDMHNNSKHKLPADFVPRTIRVLGAAGTGKSTTMASMGPRPRPPCCASMHRPVRPSSASSP